MWNKARGRGRLESSSLLPRWFIRGNHSAPQNEEGMSHAQHGCQEHMARMTLSQAASQEQEEKPEDRTAPAAVPGQDFRYQIFQDNGDASQTLAAWVFLRMPAPGKPASSPAPPASWGTPIPDKGGSECEGSTTLTSTARDLARFLAELCTKGSNRGWGREGTA